MLLNKYLGEVLTGQHATLFCIALHGITFELHHLQLVTLSSQTYIFLLFFYLFNYCRSLILDGLAAQKTSVTVHFTLRAKRRTTLILYFSPS